MLVDEVIEIIWPMSESGTKRIPANRFLNQDCAFVLGLESMLLRDPPQNPFSTGSVKLGHSAMSAQCPVKPLAQLSHCGTGTSYVRGGSH